MNKQNRVFALYSPDLRKVIVAGKQLQVETILRLFSYEPTMLRQVSSLLALREGFKSSEVHTSMKGTTIGRYNNYEANFPERPLPTVVAAKRLFTKLLTYSSFFRLLPA